MDDRAEEAGPLDAYEDTCMMEAGRSLARNVRTTLPSVIRQKTHSEHRYIHQSAHAIRLSRRNAQHAHEDDYKDYFVSAKIANRPIDQEYTVFDGMWDDEVSVLVYVRPCLAPSW